jgi:hypothetical protein
MAALFVSLLTLALSACGAGSSSGGGSDPANPAAAPASQAALRQTGGGGSGTGGVNQTIGGSAFVQTFAYYYVNYLPSAQEQPLSLYSLLDLDRISYLDDQGNSAWAKLKSLNPAIQLYVYEDSSHTYSSQDNLSIYKTALSLNSIARYDQPRPPDNPYPVGNLDQNNPGFFLLDANGNRITDTGYGFYYLDQGNPAFATFWLESVYSDIITQPWKADGIFVDGPGFALPSLSANSAKYPTDAAWATASLTFMQLVTTGLHGYGQKVWFNAGNTNTSTGQSSWEIADAWADPPDALMDEGTFSVQWGCSGSGSTINVVSLDAPGSNYQVGDVLTVIQSGASGGHVTVTSIGSGGTVAGISLTAQGTGYSAASALSVSGGHGSGCTINVSVGNCMAWIDGETQCKSSIDTLQGVSHVRAAIESHCLGSPGSSGVDNYGSPMTYWDAVYFAFSCFLLGKNTVANNSYFYWYDPSASSPLWLNEYGINLGPAVGTYQVTPYGSSNTYWRQFQNGYVYVNLSNNDVNGIVLPASFRQVTHSNVQNPFGDPTINTLNLPAHRAAILVNSSVTSW